MTEKRLDVNSIDDLFVRDELIRLYEENEQLKTRLDFCSSVNKETNKQIKLVEEKNEQLKQQLADEFNQSNCITVQKAKIKDLEKENEQLKEEVRIIDEENDNLKNITFDKQRKTIIDLQEENEQLKSDNKELKQDNDIKFWKLQFMQQHNSTQLIIHELGRAIDEGYECSNDFKEYLDNLEKKRQENIKKAERLGLDD